MNIPFNILLSCAGRRNYLIDYFQKALGAGGEVFAAAASPHAPSMIEANGRGIVLPPVTEPGYFDRLLEGCRGNNVRMLLSLNDFELPLLAREAARFREAGIIPVVSDPEIVDLCFDKWRTFEHFKALDVPTPETCLGLAAAKAALRDGRAFG
jgi:carbamoyl-phosphate synthase large subunit